MERETFEQFKTLLLGIPGWNSHGTRRAFLQDVFWGHDLLNQLNHVPGGLATNIGILFGDLGGGPEQGFVRAGPAPTVQHAGVAGSNSAIRARIALALSPRCALGSSFSPSSNRMARPPRLKACNVSPISGSRSAMKSSKASTPRQSPRLSSSGSGAAGSSRARLARSALSLIRVVVLPAPGRPSNTARLTGLFRWSNLSRWNY